MKRFVFPLLVISIFMTFSSCFRSKGPILTERIQYDVIMVSPEKDLEWWVQNLENNKREKLVRSLMDAAKSGKNKIYDVTTNKEMTQKDIADRSRRTELMSLQREDPPYEDFDTLVTRDIELSDISKVRFLEEWYMNEETGMITKKVIAMCPMLESYTESGELRGYIPLFWISYVRKFPLAKS